MTLKDFEAHIDDTILNRGLDYFQDENVDNLEKVASGMWLAHVYGTETYTVEVRTHRTQIKSWNCNCPYDHGPICKHAVAVFYAIATELESRKSHPKKIGEKKKTIRKDKVREILKKTDKKGLEDFILSQFRVQQGLKNAFIAHFADLLDEDLDVKYRTIVRNIYKSAKDRYGYIGYGNIRRFVEPLHQLLKKAESQSADKNYREALAISKTLLEEVPVFMLNMDDSDGSSGFLVDSAFEIFYEIAEGAPPMLKDELFDYCIQEYPKEKYSNFGFQSNFLNTLPSLITLQEQEKRFLELLDKQIVEAKTDHYSVYRLIGFIETKIEYLKKTNKDEEANALIEENKGYPNFRMQLVEKAIAQKDFQKAKELCHEGMAISKEKRHLGHTRQWYDKLLDIAEKEKNISDIRKYSEKLYFDNWYDMQYYKKLKATYAKDDWAKIYEGIIKNIQGSRMRGSFQEVTALADIFTEEKQWVRLLNQLQLVQGSLSLLDAYASYLIDQYPKEILGCYVIVVKENAKQTGRSIYNETAKYLKKMQKMEGGDTRVEQLLIFFKETYKNRRAMMEVLGKKFSSFNT